MHALDSKKAIYKRWVINMASLSVAHCPNGSCLLQWSNWLSTVYSQTVKGTAKANEKTSYLSFLCKTFFVQSAQFNLLKQHLQMQNTDKCASVTRVNRKLQNASQASAY